MCLQWLSIFGVLILNACAQEQPAAEVVVLQTKCVPKIEWTVSEPQPQEYIEQKRFCPT